MFWNRKCKHPFSQLVVYKDATIKHGGADFNHIDYHLKCQECGDRLTIKYAQMIGGVEQFLNRK